MYAWRHFHLKHFISHSSYDKYMCQFICNPPCQKIFACGKLFSFTLLRFFCNLLFFPHLNPEFDRKNRSGASQPVVLVIQLVFRSLWNTGLLHKLKVLWNFRYGFSGWVFGLLSSFPSRGLQVVLGGCPKNIQLMLEFLKALFFVLHLFFYILTTSWMMFVILLIMLMILLCTVIVSIYLIWTWIWPRRLLWTGADSGLLISLLEKLSLFCLTGLLTLKWCYWSENW